ncbi:MAG: LCP family protein [Actinomycetota bacterium]|nr:LCP family protein [Actinomycetota bacterium]
MSGAQLGEHGQPRYGGVLSAANVGATIVAIVVFLIGVTVWDTNLGVLLSAAAGGSASGVVWWFVSRFTAGPTLESSIEGLEMLGAIPVDNFGPASTLNDVGAVDRYTGLLRQIEGKTTGRILLISSPGPGQGASTVALNLAFAATKAGRRVMLVDADPSSRGLGRFLSTGRSPGLSDIASGTADLSGAVRMWTLGDGTRFPLLPSGDTLPDEGGLRGALIADALDSVSERADLIFIDVPPILWSSTAAELGAHADGTILVLADSADATTVIDTLNSLRRAGAPAVGYVRNRSTGTHRMAPIWWRRALLHGVAAALVLLAVFAAYTGSQLWYSWVNVKTETFDTLGIIDTVSAPAVVESEDNVELDPREDPPAQTPLTTAPEEAYETFLMIGSDKVSGAADVILYLVRPTNGADPFMVSLPRDLFVANACTGGNSRINVLIHGCEDKGVNGPSLLAHTVGEFIGIEVDHFILFDFDGFERIIDAVGGTEICVEYPVRDYLSELSLPQGCTMATGQQALAWVRSRHTQQMVNGSWRPVPGAGDLLRNKHQQEVILELFKALKTFGSPTELTTQVAGLAHTFTLDDTLSIVGAVNLAWRMRDIDLEGINRLEIPVRLARSKSGDSILLATASFDEVLMSVYGGSLPHEDSSGGESPALNQQAVEWREPLRGTE